MTFTAAAKVCERPKSSRLHDFNPLGDSEPNLEFDMTNQNNTSKLDLHVKLMQDAKTHKWQIKIRNLSKEQIEFIAGPQLLPALSKAYAVVIEHGENSQVKETSLPSTTDVLTTDSTAKNASANDVINEQN